MRATRAAIRSTGMLDRDRQTRKSTGMPLTEPLTLSSRDVADRLGVSRPTVARLIATGDLQAHRVGRQYRFTESDLDAYLQSARVAS